MHCRSRADCIELPSALRAVTCRGPNIAHTKPPAYDSSRRQRRHRQRQQRQLQPSFHPVDGALSAFSNVPLNLVTCRTSAAEQDWICRWGQADLIDCTRRTGTSLDRHLALALMPRNGPEDHTAASSRQHRTMTRSTSDDDGSAPAAEMYSDTSDQENRRPRTKIPRKCRPPHRLSQASSSDDGDDPDEDVFIAMKASGSRKTSIPPANELKLLRTEAVALEREFEMLCAKWRNQLPDERILQSACTAAKEKTITMQVERVNTQLKEQLLQQQLYFASLQSALTASPLWTSSRSCRELFYEMHHGIHLGADERSRYEILRGHFERSVRVIQGIVHRCTKDHIERTTPAVPYSHTGSTGTEDCTYLSNVFICKIPNTTVNQVFPAAVDTYVRLPEQLKQHINLELEAKILQSISNSRHYTRLSSLNGHFAGMASNMTFVTEKLDDGSAAIIADFAEEDELYPVSASPLRRDGVSMLLLSNFQDPTSGQQCVLLRRLLAHRYNLLPNSTRLHSEIQSILAHLNGDLAMAMLCESLRAAVSPSPYALRLKLTGEC